MRRRRLKAATRWCCSACSVLLVAVSVWSRWYAVGYSRFARGYAISATLWPGVVQATWNETAVIANAPDSAWSRLSVFAVPGIGKSPSMWQPKWHAEGASFAVLAPLWIPFALTFVPGVVLWTLELKRRRRVARGLCEVCGYNRAGLTADAKCPECGTPTLPTK